MHTNAYKGGGGLNMTKSTHFVRRYIEMPQYLKHLRIDKGYCTVIGIVPLRYSISISSYSP